MATRRVGDVAQEEHPHDGEQQGAGDHQEPGVAEGELEANAQPRGSIHAPAAVRLGVDAVSGARDGGDDPGLAEALAQRRDGDAHGVGERVRVLVPRPLQELFGADDTAFGGDEDLEHGELLAGQRDVAAVAVDLAAERIDAQARDLAHGRPVVGAPAVQRPEPEHELLELEGLGEVVVGAELEPGGLVVEPVGGGEHEDRHAAAGGDDASGDLVAGGPGDVAVEDGDVVGVDAQQLQGGVAVAGDVGGDRFQAEAVADGLGHVGLVLDEQHTHAPMLEPAHIVGVSKIAYAPATPRSLLWGRAPQTTSTQNDTSDPDSQEACRRRARRRRGDRRSPRAVAGDLVLDGVLVPDGHGTDRGPSQRAAGVRVARLRAPSPTVRRSSTTTSRR